MNSLKSMSTLDLIKNLYITQNLLSKIKLWQFWYKYKLNIRCKNIISEFLNNRDLFDQANILSSIIINLNNNSELISSILYHDLIKIDDSSIIINNTEIKIIYSYIKNQFIIDMNPIDNKLNNGYFFIYSKSTKLIPEFQKIWDKDIISIIKNKFMNFLLNGFNPLLLM